MEFAAHAFPQAPQSSLLEDMSTQTLPHIDCPGSQAHPPATHLLPPEQTFLQPPQLLLLVSVSTQLCLQSVSFGPHEHTPPEHDVLPTHSMPHPPQLRMSLETSTQPPPHATSGAMQLCTHLFFAQSSPGPHAFPQTPQFVELDWGSTQKPLHKVTPAGHSQAPALQ
jgi:hypothetical protein